MKMYKINGFCYWFNEGEQPKGAIEVVRDEKKATEEKSLEPKNKSRKASKTK